MEKLSIKGQKAINRVPKKLRLQISIVPQVLNSQRNFIKVYTTMEMIGTYIISSALNYECILGAYYDAN